MRRALSVLAVVALLVAACGGDGELELTGADSGASLEIAQGDEVVVSLESNQTTGFRWNLVSEPDPAVVDVASTTYVEPEDGLVGEGGVEVWRFEAVGPGTTSLELGYFQPWEPENVEGSFVLEIEVG